MSDLRRDWDAPDELLVSSCHIETLRTRLRERIVWELTPEENLETPEAVWGEIAQELELTGNRLVRLAARLRATSAQRLSTTMGAHFRPRPDRARLISESPTQAQA